MLVSPLAPLVESRPACRPQVRLAVVKQRRSRCRGYAAPVATHSADSGDKKGSPPGSTSLWEGVKWLLNSRGDLRHFYNRRFDRLGNIFQTNILLKDCVVIGGTDRVKQVLAKEQTGEVLSHWSDSFMTLLGPLGILFAPSAAHERLRRIVAPAFSRRSVASQLPRVQHLTAAAVSRWAAVCSKSSDVFIELQPSIRELFLSIVVTMVVGDQSQERMQRLAGAFEHLVAGLLAVGPVFERAKEAREVLVSEMSAIIAGRRQSAGASHASPPNDILGSLMASVDESGTGLSDEEIIDNCIAFLFAGHSTTSAAATSLLTLVAQSSEAKTAILNEISTWPSEERAPGGPLSTDRTLDNVLLQNIIAEALRVAPPATQIMRKAARDFTVDEYTVPKGTQLSLNLDRGHHDPTVFENPQQFCPMRFMSKGASKGGGARFTPPSSLLSFGSGLHTCIGADLARLNLSVLLVMLHRDAEYILDPHADHSLANVTAQGVMPRSKLLARVVATTSAS